MRSCVSPASEHMNINRRANKEKKTAHECKRHLHDMKVGDANGQTTGTTEPKTKTVCASPRRAVAFLTCSARRLFLDRSVLPDGAVSAGHKEVESTIRSKIKLSVYSRMSTRAARRVNHSCCALLRAARTGVMKSTNGGRSNV